MAATSSTRRSSRLMRASATSWRQHTRWDSGGRITVDGAWMAAVSLVGRRRTPLSKSTTSTGSSFSSASLQASVRVATPLSVGSTSPRRPTLQPLAFGHFTSRATSPGRVVLLGPNRLHQALAPTRCLLGPPPRDTGEDSIQTWKLLEEGQSLEIIQDLSGA